MKIVLYQDRDLTDPRIKNILSSVRYYFESSKYHFIYCDNYKKPISCDVAIIWGIKKNSSRKTYYREEIKTFQKKNGSKTICIERGFIQRDLYFSVGFNSIVGWGDYGNDCQTFNHSRRNLLQIDYPTLKHNPKGHILVCGQVYWDSQLQHLSPGNPKIGLGYNNWLVGLMNSLNSEINSQEIIFREHPTIYNTSTKVLNKFAPDWIKWKKQYMSSPKITFSTNNFEKDLSGCYGVIAFNSNSLCEAIIKGYPVLSFDRGSVVHDLASHSIKDFLSNPQFPSRSLWEQTFNRISYSQWNVSEIKQGLPFDILLNNG